MSIHGKDPLSQQIVHSISKQSTLLVRPKVGLKHMLEDIRIVESNDASNLGYRVAPDFAVLAVHHGVVLCELVARNTKDGDEISDQRQTAWANDVFARFGAQGGRAVLEQDVEDVDTQHFDHVLAFQGFLEKGEDGCDCEGWRHILEFSCRAIVFR